LFPRIFTGGLEREDSKEGRREGRKEGRREEEEPREGRPF
jgi:hypothetical protein